MGNCVCNKADSSDVIISTKHKKKNNKNSIKKKEEQTDSQLNHDPNMKQNDFFIIQTPNSKIDEFAQTNENLQSIREQNEFDVLTSEKNLHCQTLDLVDIKLSIIDQTKKQKSPSLKLSENTTSNNSPFNPKIQLEEKTKINLPERKKSILNENLINNQKLQMPCQNNIQPTTIKDTLAQLKMQFLHESYYSSKPGSLGTEVKIQKRFFESFNEHSFKIDAENDENDIALEKVIQSIEPNANKNVLSKSNPFSLLENYELKLSDIKVVNEKTKFQKNDYVDLPSPITPIGFGELEEQNEEGKEKENAKVEINSNDSENFQKNKEEVKKLDKNIIFDRKNALKHKPEKIPIFSFNHDEIDNSLMNSIPKNLDNEKLAFTPIDNMGNDLEDALKNY